MAELAPFRPGGLDELRLSDRDRRYLKAFREEPRELVDLLVTGPTGAGRSTFAKVLDDELDVSLTVDADAATEGAAAVDRVKEAARRVTSQWTEVRVLAVENVDDLRRSGEARLRSLLDLERPKTRLLLTARDRREVARTVADRCRHLPLHRPDQATRERILRHALVEEEVEASDELVALYAQRFISPQQMLLAAQESLATGEGELREPPAAGEKLVTVQEALDREAGDEGFPWDLRPLTQKGTFTLLYGAPKAAGKSTWCRVYAARKAGGGTFLGEDLDPAPVLWVGLDEDNRDICRHFASLDPHGGIHLWEGARPEVDELARAVRQQGVGLVVVDTLPRLARLPSETANAPWTQFYDRLLPHVRGTDAAWVGVHHTRKAGGGAGRDVRGASAILGAVDIAVRLSPSSRGERCRRLSVVGSRYEQPDDQIIRLDPDEPRYEIVDESAASQGERGSGDRAEKVLEVLEEENLTQSEIAERLEEAGTDVSDQTVYSWLNQLVEAGKLEVEGTGERGDARRWSIANS